MKVFTVESDRPDGLQRDQLILREAATGMTVRESARRHGLSYQRISQIRNAAGRSHSGQTGRPRRSTKPELEGIRPWHIEPARVYTAEGAAIVLGLNPKSVKNLILRGELEGRDVGGSGGYRISGRALHRYLRPGPGAASTPAARRSA